MFHLRRENNLTVRLFAARTVCMNTVCTNTVCMNAEPQRRGGAEKYKLHGVHFSVATGFRI